MIKKSVIAAIIAIFLFSLIRVVTADPYGILPTSPEKEPPTINLESLIASGNDSSVQLNFSITIPESWTATAVYKVDCELDAQSNITLYDSALFSPTNIGYAVTNATQFSTTFSNLTLGAHSLQINVYSSGLFNPPPLPSNWLDPCKYYSTLTQIIPFTVNAASNVTLSSSLPSLILNSYLVLSYSAQRVGVNLSQPTPTETATTTTTPTLTFTLSPSPTPSQSPSPSPSPIPTQTQSSSPSPSIAPSPTKQPTVEPSLTPSNAQENFASIPIIVGLVVVTVAVAGTLFYFSRRKGRI